MEVFRKVMGELVKGLLAFVISCVGYGGYYPLLPAYFAMSCMEGKPPLSVLIGAVWGILVFMPPNSMIKYFFALFVIGVGIRIFVGINRSCDSMSAGIIGGVSIVALNLAGTAMWKESGTSLLLGLCEGVMVLGLSLGIYGLCGMSFGVEYFLKEKLETGKSKLRPAPSVHRMESLAYAVSGLSDVLFAMSLPKGVFTPQQQYGEAEPEEVTPYEDMKMAWNHRLMENRYVIAQQLDAMADLMQEWTKVRIYADHKYEISLAAVIYGTRDKGLLIEDLHVYEEKNHICVEGYVSCGWNGGISVKHYIRMVEKAFGRDMRAGRNTKNILTGEPVFLCLYEDTNFYTLQGSVTEKKSDSNENGDCFSFFSLDDGTYHVCLSDGMGSGEKAREESEMVIELMQKFMEAGFKKETAVKMLNSAMVLQGEEDSYSTLDYGVIDLYTGDLELLKIGGAATFLKSGEEVECLDTGTLPAGADARMEVESAKRTLRNGDFLVMVTDGVIEYLHVRSPREAMIDIIARAKTENAQALAEYIMLQVTILTGGIPKDDMTVLVTGIWEKE